MKVPKQIWITPRIDDWESYSETRLSLDMNWGRLLVSLGAQPIVLDPNWPEEFLEHSQPFFTGNSANPGSGLGLSIAKDIAKSHGGYLSSEAIENGEGKQVSIILPVG